MPNVKITGWRTGFNKVECTRALKVLPGIGLAEAKRITDAVMEGEIKAVAVRTLEEAQALEAHLQTIGAVAHVDAAL